MTLQLDPEIQKRVDAWIEGPFDEETKAEIRRLISQNPKELANAFFKEMSFGTGGMRGIMGVGTNRMNIYTVRLATQGLANYLKKQPEPENGYSVFIGYDVRHHSREFAEEASRVLVGNDIRVFLSREICPTPLVSFACRYFECSAGLVITASHNPPQYNGYKVYWRDGGQVVPPHDIGIMEEVHLVKTIRIGSIDSPLIHGSGREIDDAYLAELDKIRLLNLDGSFLNIVYTNLHGTGIRIIPEALKRHGFQSLSLVESQTAPNGDFPNAPSPNPEEEKALALGTAQLIESGADILLATDPDADRMGVVVNHRNQAVRLSGNQIACLCLEHIATCLTQKKEFPENAGVIKTIVTTELFRTIAESFGGTCVDCLTGFKYVAEMIHQWETSFGGLQFLFGAEESYGYLFGTFVRDKDAISSCCLIAELAARLKRQGKTLVDQLHSLYQQYGIHRESLTSLGLSDTPTSLKEIQTMMEHLRGHPPSHIGGIKVVSVEDYANGTMPLPSSDVLRFWLEDGSKLVIRPSGTEPKIKIYAEVIGKSSGEIEKDIEACDIRLKQLVEAFQKKLAQP